MPTHRVVTMDELTAYLHLPEKAVAKHLGICLTSLKKLCRQHGITRWPYRKLKSLDKKIAKVENGTGMGTEDALALKARAEELKKEKMAVAFTYGLKEKNETESICSEVEGSSSSSDRPPSKPKKKSSAKSSAAPSPAPSVHMTSSPSMHKGVPSDWPFRRLSDDTSIPTPPDEHLADHGDHDDIFGKDVDNVLGSRDNSMLDENGMHPTGWDGDADNLDEISSHKNVVDVKLEPSPISRTNKDKLGATTMALVIPSASRSTVGGSATRAPVSDADMQIASALASSVTAVKTSCAESKVHIDDDQEEVAHQPKFILDEGHADHPFHSELMDSEFFAELPKHGPAHADEEDDHTVCIESSCRHAPGENELSPSNTAASSNSTVPEVHVPEICELPSDHHISMSGDCWGEDAHSWFSPDSPDKKVGGESVHDLLPRTSSSGVDLLSSSLNSGLINGKMLASTCHQSVTSESGMLTLITRTGSSATGGGPSPPTSDKLGLDPSSLLAISPSPSVH